MNKDKYTFWTINIVFHGLVLRDGIYQKKNFNNHNLKFKKRMERKKHVKILGTR